MGRGQRHRTGRTKKVDSDDEENIRIPSKSKSTFVFSDSDDDAEANEDLSLKIVAKAMSRSSSDAPRGRDNGFAAGKSEVADGSDDDFVMTELVSLESSKKKIKKAKKKKKVNKIETEAEKTCQDNVLPEGQKQHNTETIELIEDLEVAKDGVDNSDNALQGLEVAKDAVDNSDNAVLRRLLRGPRYFDVSENSSWGMCYNCGEDGHMAVNCKSAKKKKPCFVCGSFEHGAKECQKGKDCFICNKSGHRAKDCPKKYKKSSQRSDLCLKCGSSGHAMSSCNNGYSLDDLKEIQCYVCKSFGHLCCANYFGTVPSEVSCYKCGQLGHTGLACRGGRGEMSGERTPSSCFKCGEEGHFARECSNSVKAYGHGEMGGERTPSSCYKCGEGGHFARECATSVKAKKKRNREMSTPKRKASKENSYQGYKSAPQEVDKAYKKKKNLQFDEENTPSSSKWKPWNRWIPEDTEYFPRGKGAENGGWDSYLTPNDKDYNIYRTPERYASTARSPRRLDSPYSRTRWGNPSNGEPRRNYDRW